MALIPHCDRCQRPAQIVTVLGSELCPTCIEEVREVIAKAPRDRLDKRLSGRMVNFPLVVKRHLKTQGYVCARELGEQYQEPYRRMYFALLHLKKKGELVNAGNGRFLAAEQRSEVA